MRRLQVLPCPESWERMREDGDGRFCERCQLRVTEVAKLDDAGLERLIGAAERGRVCASFELEAGRPRLGLAVAASLLSSLVMTGCATPSVATTTPDLVGVKYADSLGRVTGAIVVDQTVEHTSNHVPIGLRIE
jgi:hypothetical protein